MRALSRSNAFMASSMIVHFRRGERRLSFGTCVDQRVTELGYLKGVHASRACATTLEDFDNFVGSARILLCQLGTSLLTRCRTCLGNEKGTPGAVSFCVHVLGTICGHTIRSKLARRQRPFGSICAKIRGAVGQTLSLGSVEHVGKLSLSLGSGLSCTHSVFLFYFCAEKVSFVSVTCLEGGSLRGNALSCHEHGAKRRLFVG